MGALEERMADMGGKGKTATSVELAEAQRLVAALEQPKPKQPRRPTRRKR